MEQKLPSLKDFDYINNKKLLPFLYTTIADESGFDYKVLNYVESLCKLVSQVLVVYNNDIGVDFDPNVKYFVFDDNELNKFGIYLTYDMRYDESLLNNIINSILNLSVKDNGSSNIPPN